MPPDSCLLLTNSHDQFHRDAQSDQIRDLSHKLVLPGDSKIKLSIAVQKEVTLDLQMSLRIDCQDFHPDGGEVICFLLRGSHLCTNGKIPPRLRLRKPKPFNMQRRSKYLDIHAEERRMLPIANIGRRPGALDTRSVISMSTVSSLQRQTLIVLEIFAENNRSTLQCIFLLLATGRPPIQRCLRL
jgi:hypothetical protein